MSTCKIGKAVTLDNGEVINEQVYKIRHEEGLDGYETPFEHLPKCDFGPEP